MIFKIVDSSKNHIINWIPFVLILAGLAGISFYYTGYKNSTLLIISILSLFGSIFGLRLILTDHKGFKFTKQNLKLDSSGITIMKEGKETRFQISTLRKLKVTILDFDHGAPGYTLEPDNEVVKKKLTKHKLAFLNPFTYAETTFVPNRGNDNFISFAHENRSYKYEFYLASEDDLESLKIILKKWDEENDAICLDVFRNSNKEN